MSTAQQAMRRMGELKARLDRFDDQGRSRLATDPIALPFPVSADDPEDAPANAELASA